MSKFTGWFTGCPFPNFPVCYQPVDPSIFKINIADIDASFSQFLFTAWQNHLSFSHICYHFVWAL